MKFNLKQARLYAGFSQGEIANIIGVAKPTYQKYEAGRKMRIDTAERFSQAVNIPMEQIIF